MKKLISAFLAMTCVFGLSFGVWADDSEKFDSNTDGNPPYDCEVPVTVTVDTSKVKTRYNVVVSWSDLEFTFDRGDAEWQPEDDTTANPAVTGHTYSEGSWKDGGVKTAAIKVANHSNAEVSVAVSKIQNVKGVTVTPTLTTGFDDAVLKSADIDGIYGKYANADYVTYDVTATGIPEFEGEDVALDNLTVTISAV